MPAFCPLGLPDCYRCRIYAFCQLPVRKGGRMTEYFVTTPSVSDVALRVDHNTESAPMDYIPKNTSMKVSEVFTATRELKTLSGKTYQTIGDKWARVTYGNATGWVACIHRGAVFCHLREGDEPLPQPAPLPARIQATMRIETVINGVVYAGMANVELRVKV